MNTTARHLTGMAVAAALLAGLSEAPANAEAAPANNELARAPLSSATGPDTVVVTSADEDSVVTTVEGDEFSGVTVVELDDDGLFAPIEVSATTGGEFLSDTFTVEEFTLLEGSGDDYAATLRSASTGETFAVNTSMVEQQALPAIILGLLARQGLKAAIKFYGKTQVKKAAKSYLLNSLSANKWSHIMAPKHRWSEVGAKSKEQIADIMASAMAGGRHSAYGSAKQAVWTYKGRTIKVTYSNGGQISNGWVVAR